MLVHTGANSQLGGLYEGRFSFSYQSRKLLLVVLRPLRKPPRRGSATNPAAGRCSAIDDIREDMFFFTVLD